MLSLKTESRRVDDLRNIHANLRLLIDSYDRLLAQSHGVGALFAALKLHHDVLSDCRNIWMSETACLDLPEGHVAALLIDQGESDDSQKSSFSERLSKLGVDHLLSIRNLVLASADIDPYSRLFGRLKKHVAVHNSLYMHIKQLTANIPPE